MTACVFCERISILVISASLLPGCLVLDYIAVIPIYDFYVFPLLSIGVLAKVMF
jgi:hypothetical protein